MLRAAQKDESWFRWFCMRCPNLAQRVMHDRIQRDLERRGKIRLRRFNDFQNFNLKANRILRPWSRPCRIVMDGTSLGVDHVHANDAADQNMICAAGELTQGCLKRRRRVCFEAGEKTQSDQGAQCHGRSSLMFGLAGPRRQGRLAGQQKIYGVPAARPSCPAVAGPAVGVG